MRTRKCMLCGYAHDTCEAAMEISNLLRDAMNIVIEGRAIMQEMKTGAGAHR